jgi:hypothetical protein
MKWGISQMNKRTIRLRRLVAENWGWDCHDCGKPLVPDQYGHNDKYVNIAEDGTISAKPPFEFPVLVQVDEDSESPESFRLMCEDCEAKYDNNPNVEE